MNDYNQGVVAGGIGMRGFNTKGDTMHVKLLVDGIPTNVNSGVGDLNAIFPLNIDRMEVVKGTRDPRYGLTPPRRRNCSAGLARERRGRQAGPPAET